jgi:hypothetical protein
MIDLKDHHGKFVSSIERILQDLGLTYSSTRSKKDSYIAERA